MAFLTLAVLTGLCLLLASTRKYAVFGAGLLLYFYPYHSLSLLALAGAGYLFHRRRHRRNHVSPQPDD